MFGAGAFIAGLIGAMLNNKAHLIVLCLFGFSFLLFAGFKTWRDLQFRFLSRRIESLNGFLERLRNDYREESRYPLKPSSIPADNTEHNYLHKELIRFQHECRVYQDDLEGL